MRYSIFAVLIFMACQNDPSGIEGSSSVSGILMYNGEPLSGAEVSVGDHLNWKSMTDRNGHFFIENISTGEHILNSEYHSEQGTSSISTPIYLVQGANNLAEVLLPVPSNLFEITSNNDQIELKWSKTFDEDFREYKVYRKKDAGLDETTGDLIFISTFIGDTSYTDDSFVPGLEYFYRVYTLASNGKVGGSNIGSIKTDPQNFVQNGGFEESDNPTYWDIPDYNPDFGLPGIFELDDSVRYEGEQSLVITIPDTLDVFHGDVGFEQKFSNSVFQEETTYKITLRVKPRDFEVGAFIKREDTGVLLTKNLRATVQNDWVELSDEFQVTDNSGQITLRIYGLGYLSSNELKGWVDDVKINAID